MGRASTNYPRELRERAVLMVAEVRAEYPSEWAAIGAVARKRNRVRGDATEMGTAGGDRCGRLARRD